MKSQSSTATVARTRISLHTLCVQRARSSRRRSCWCSRRAACRAHTLVSKSSRLFMTSTRPAVVIAEGLQGVCDDMSATLVKDVYQQIGENSAANTMEKADSSYFSLADGVVQVYPPSWHSCRVLRLPSSSE